MVDWEGSVGVGCWFGVGDDVDVDGRIEKPTEPDGKRVQVPGMTCTTY